MPKKPTKAKRTQPEADGFRWEQWRNGVLWMRGAHNGSTLDGKDASWQHKEFCVAIPLSVVEHLLNADD